MTKRVQDENSAALNEEGVRRFWTAIIQQAIDDLDNGGFPGHSPESQNTKHQRLLEAYHWLMTDRSELAFRVQGVDADYIREVLREKVRTGKIVLDLNRSPDKRKVAEFPTRQAVTATVGEQAA
jgi:hypothetical protein